jgi:phosphoribosylglycinamide formyltransferase-1
VMECWRRAHDVEIERRIPPVDVFVLLGWLWIFGPGMCAAHTIVNLHPALPGGPRGLYTDVIWQLIADQARETGAMIHLTTAELDRGPAIAFCRFSIRGERYDPLWAEMEQASAERSISEIARRDGEHNELFALIRRQGVIREQPLILTALRSLARGTVRIDRELVMDSEGCRLAGGHDLTEEIDAIVGPAE